MQEAAVRPYATVVLPNIRRVTSRWWVFDFDVHGPGQSHHTEGHYRDIRRFIQSARALAAVGIFYIVEDSARGWHCWLIASEQKTAMEWKEIADGFKNAVRFTQPFEEFPTFGGKTKGARLPGSSNVMTWDRGTQKWQCSTIVEHNLPNLLNPPFTISEEEILYSASKAGTDLPKLAEQLLWRCMITAPSSRHDSLMALMGSAVYLLGEKVAMRCAAELWRRATPLPQTKLEDHMREAKEVYDTLLEQNVLGRFNAQEASSYHSIASSYQEIFKLTWNFAKEDAGGEFYFSGPHFARCLGVTSQFVYSARAEFLKRRFLEVVQDKYVPGKVAKRCRWMLNHAR